MKAGSENPKEIMAANLTPKNETIEEPDFMTLILGPLKCK